jgi:TIR domain/Nucleoside 2-deoxyribosyltransferase
MIKKATPYDVFISHAAADAKLATSFAKAFRLSGLEPFTDYDVSTSENVSDTVWEALAVCKALVAILSHAELSPAMSVEIGAAQAWNKPIYAVVSDPASIRLPSALSRMRLVVPGAIEDIIRDIKTSADELTDDDRETLQAIYLEIGVPLDRFASDHLHLRRLTQQFNRRSRKQVSGERLLAELLRMRKRGKLPALRRNAV